MSTPLTSVSGFARRRSQQQQKRRFSTSALASTGTSGSVHHRPSYTSYASARSPSGSRSRSPESFRNGSGRSEVMMPTASTPNTLAFPQYFSDDETLHAPAAAGRTLDFFSEPEETATSGMSLDSEPAPRSLQHRRRQHTTSHDLDLAQDAGWPDMLNSDQLRAAYASLPSSPIVRNASPAFQPPIRVKKEEEEDDEKDALLRSLPPRSQSSRLELSLWDYLREELLATDFDSHQELKWERVGNFLGVPLALERLILFGCVLCFDSFLYTFTILPIRFILALWRITSNFFSSILRRRSTPLPPSQKADILRSLIILITLGVLLPTINTSKIYHSIRGQDTIKLYVIFNALEVADRLLTSIGQDVIDCMFARSTLVLLSSRIRPSPSTFKPLLFFVLSCLYTVAHTTILVYQLISLNIAINAFDNSLLTLLLSNQFVEIKGSVFKKFEKDNLFQITCADIVERFQLSLMLVAIAVRNLIELSASGDDLWTKDAVLPKAFNLGRGGSLLWTTFSPVLTVLVSELAVDWLKHAFITKFNHIRPSVYDRYTDVLCRDLDTSSSSHARAASEDIKPDMSGNGRGSSYDMDRKHPHPYVDQSPAVARRLGFAVLPLAILAVLVGQQSLGMVVANASSASGSSYPSPTATFFGEGPVGMEAGGIAEWVDWAGRVGPWIGLGIGAWFCLVTIKLILGINLLHFARRRAAGGAMERRIEEDEGVNYWGRPAIGEGRAERAYNLELKEMLSQARDDAVRVPDIGESSTTGGGKSNKKKGIPLEELTRFTMVKRIW